jgi:hypothetical protein
MPSNEPEDQLDVHDVHGRCRRLGCPDNAHGYYRDGSPHKFCSQTCASLQLVKANLLGAMAVSEARNYSPEFCDALAQEQQALDAVYVSWSEFVRRRRMALDIAVADIIADGRPVPASFPIDVPPIDAHAGAGATP